MGKIGIAFLIGAYGIGGKERQLTEIIRNLPGKYYDIHLFVKCENSHYIKMIQSNVSSYFSLEKESFRLSDIFILRRFLKKINPEVVYSFSTTLSHFSLIINLIGGMNYRLINGTIRGAPIVFNLHLAIERFLYNFYKEVIANSKAGLESYHQSKKNGRHVLYNGYDTNRTPHQAEDELKKKLGIKNKFTAVMVASMGDSKDQNTFIKAAFEVLQYNSGIQFFLIGDGPKREEYMRLVSSLGIHNNVFFTGEVKNVEEYLKASDLSILMSKNSEGFPNAILESLACGTPAIGNNNGGTKELLINNQTGYLIDPFDYKKLAELIEKLYRNRKTLERLSKNGINHVQTEFSMNKMITNLEEIINNKIHIAKWR